MARYKVILEYDGSDFHGFQKQAQARTVQGVVESVLRTLGWEEASLQAAGRTDSGVHASGQVIAFDFKWKHSLADLQRALNSQLPVDVSARSIYLVRADFHPRFSAQSRRYCYTILCEEIRRPLKERYAWRVWPKVNLELMQMAAQYLQGTHDFSAFGAPTQPGGSTIRTIKQAGWVEAGSDIVFDIVGNAFLYHMIRHLVFWQVAIGQGRMGVEMIPKILAGEVLDIPQGLAPPGGLNLVEVVYPSEYII